MARTVLGTIADQEGAPVCGVRVEAWDDDWPDGDDLMGTAITDDRGAYTITYDGGHWDPAPRGTSWRPDVFIAVRAKTVGGDWAYLAKSPVHVNHDLDDDLRIDLTVTLDPVEQCMTTFDPGKHGYHFPNRFELQPQLFGIELGTWELGLCGGMSAGAVRCFTTNKPAPTMTLPPPADTALFDELLHRQKRSLAIGVLQRIYDWQSAPDVSHAERKHSIGYRTRQEWPALKAALDAGQPTQLVLIRVEGYLANPTRNHQVVAIGYEWNPVTKDLAIFDYDPNTPGQVNKLTMNFGLDLNRLEAEDSTGEPLRGFFVNTAGSDAARWSQSESEHFAILAP